MRAPRMPRIEELPIPAQNQIRARAGEAGERRSGEAAQSLLQRLASVGLGRREEDDAARQPRPAAGRSAAAPPMPKAPPMPPLPRPQEPRGRIRVGICQAPVAAAPAPQGLDQHGRQAPVNNSIEDDQLEIPAFLRRQAN